MMANCGRILLRRAAAANRNLSSTARLARTVTTMTANLGSMQTRQTLFRPQPQFLLQSRGYSDETGDVEAEKEVVKEPVVVVDKDQQLHVMSIAINRPEKRNCVNEETAAALWKAFDDFENDDNMRVAVLHGLGGNFCAGYDLEELSHLSEKEVPNMLASIIERGPMGPTRMELSKPTIAAVTGWAVAGGLELALMCDLRIVEESAKMGVLCRRFGVPLIDGGTVRLPELIGLSRALDLILTGRVVEAKEAHQMGLANRLVKDETAYGTAVNLAREMVRFPQECMKADRASAYHAVFTSKGIEDALQFEAENGAHIINKESIEGAKRFASGLGRHGKFGDVNRNANKQQWEIEYEQMEKEDQEKRAEKKDD